MPRETEVIQHRVKLKDSTPIHCKPYPLPYAKRQEIWNEVGSMLEMGEMRPSTLPYASPIVMVKKLLGRLSVADHQEASEILPRISGLL